MPVFISATVLPEPPSVIERQRLPPAMPSVLAPVARFGDRPAAPVQEADVFGARVQIERAGIYGDGGSIINLITARAPELCSPAGAAS